MNYHTRTYIDTISRYYQARLNEVDEYLVPIHVDTYLKNIHEELIFEVDEDAFQYIDKSTKKQLTHIGKSLAEADKHTNQPEKTSNHTASFTRSDPSLQGSLSGWEKIYPTKNIIITKYFILIIKYIKRNYIHYKYQRYSYFKIIEIVI